MATKAKKPAKGKAAAKKAAPKKAAPVKKAKASIKAKAAKPRPKPKAAAKPKRAAASKASAKKSASARKPAKPVKKTAVKPAAKAAPKTPSAKSAAAVKAPTRADRSKASKLSPVPSVAPVVMPPPKPLAARPAVTASPKDVAAATEYLLTRTATRSEAPVVVNGKVLPTEGQMLKMPDSAYLNEEQLAFFKYRLQQIEKELLANAGETTEHLRETVIVPDPADRATIEEEHALELRTRDRERKLLKKVQSSLASIESGEYGYCEETGEPIGIPRLLARPTATLSLEAQQRREMKQKLFGD